MTLTAAMAKQAALKAIAKRGASRYFNKYVRCNYCDYHCEHRICAYAFKAPWPP